MQPFARIIIALALAAAAAIGSVTPAAAYYIGGPGFGVWVDPRPRYYYPPPPPPPYGYYGRRRLYCYPQYGLCCPRGWTVQDGVCKPYRGY